MDPNLEHPTIFPGLHNRLIAGISDALQATLPAPYFAEIGERIWVEVAQGTAEHDACAFHDERRETWVEIRQGLKIHKFKMINIFIICELVESRCTPWSVRRPCFRSAAVASP
jgi:hypothetical protein